jgi:hypothetical protein
MCDIFDLSCNMQNLAQWIYSFFAPYLDPILNLISALINLIGTIIGLLIGFFTALFTLGDSLVNLIGSLAGVSGDPYYTAIFAFISTYIGIVVFIRVWNIVAGISIWGFKLPRIPL